MTRALSPRRSPNTARPAMIVDRFAATEDGDHRDAFAELQASRRGVEREDRGGDDDHAPGTEKAGGPALEVSREGLHRHVGDAEAVPRPRRAALPAAWDGARSCATGPARARRPRRSPRRGSSPAGSTRSSLRRSRVGHGMTIVVACFGRRASPLLGSGSRYAVLRQQASRPHMGNPLDECEHPSARRRVRCYRRIQPILCGTPTLPARSVAVTLWQ